MRKLAIIGTLAALLVSIPSIAQEELTFNPKLGINIATLNSEPGELSSKNRTGFNIGMDLRLGSGLLYFQPGAHFYHYKRQFTIDRSGQPAPQVSSNEISVSSINIPAQLGIRPIATDVLTLRFNAGPNFSFPVVVDNNEEDFEITSANYEDFVVGGLVGAGIDIAVMTLDVTYEFGISDYISFSETSNFNPKSTRQSVLTVSLGVRL